jgi:Rieske Fe-S protein
MESPGRMGQRELIAEQKDTTRRTFLGQGLALALLGFGRRLWAQALDPFSYQPLARPVLVPLDDLATPGRAFPFVADGVTLASAATPNRPIRISGMVVRMAAGDSAPERFKAVCVRCPHEGCDVDFVVDPSKLPQEITDQIGHAVTEPVYVCPCHNSTFKIDDGARLAGPAPRGLYRFRVTGVTAAAVEIAEVEEDVLLFAGPTQ